MSEGTAAADALIANYERQWVRRFGRESPVDYERRWSRQIDELTKLVFTLAQLKTIETTYPDHWERRYEGETSYEQQKRHLRELIEGSRPAFTKMELVRLGLDDRIGIVDVVPFATDSNRAENRRGTRRSVAQR